MSRNWFPDVPRLTEHPGYSGTFTRHQAEGAWANGTRVAKQNSERCDANPNGSLGTILGSFKRPAEVTGRPGLDFTAVTYCYFVEWDSMPKVAVGTIDIKLRKAE